jgi:hypothetical protein
MKGKCRKDLTISDHRQALDIEKYIGDIGHFN